ncbi:MAG: DJ-1/PfpI family protein [Paludibaculum sp.]
MAEVFGLDRPEMGPGWYRFASCAIEKGPLRAHGGFALQPDHGPELLAKADIIVVPGWKGAYVPVPERLCDLLRAAHARGARLVSICSGAFVLGATKLLDGGTATTHWRYAAALQARFRRCRSMPARSIAVIIGSSRQRAARPGSILIDIVRQDFGPRAANSVARRLVVSAHRTGGQAQFLERPVPVQPGREIAPLLDRIRNNLKRSWTTGAMARECKMSFESSPSLPGGNRPQSRRLACRGADRSRQSPVVRAA